MPVFDADRLIQVGMDIFRAAGASDEEAAVVARHLVTSNLVGHDSHGVIRIPSYIRNIRAGDIRPGARTEVIRETSSTAVLNGNWGFGQVTATRAMEIAIEKASGHAISSVGIRDCNHVGRVGEYPPIAAERNMIGVMTVNDHGAGRLTAPWGGIDRRISPNPIAISLPTGGEPLMLDMTMSVTAEGKIRVKRNRREQTPEGWIIDSEGRPTTDPEVFYGDPPGAILPMGGVVGYKGYGLGLFLDILGGALTGAGCSRPGVDRVGNGTFIIVIAIEAFTSLDEFKRHVDSLMAFVKSSRTMPGFDEILVPGEPESREKRRRLAEGIFVEEETWRQIGEIAEEIGVSV